MEIRFETKNQKAKGLWLFSHTPPCLKRLYVRSTSKLIAGKQDRQAPSCQERGKRMVTNDFLKTTSACSFALPRFATPTAESPPQFCAHGGNAGVKTKTHSQRVGISSGSDFVVYLKANANPRIMAFAIMFYASVAFASVSPTTPQLSAQLYLTPWLQFSPRQHDRTIPIWSSRDAPRDA